MAQQPDSMTDAPTTQDPEQMRRDIARTREEMSTTVEAIEDRVSPRRIRDRQAARLRGRWDDARTSVMGSPDAGTDLRQRASRAGEAVQHVPDRARETTRGNPLAAGMVAFGVGALAGTLLPVTAPEQRAAARLRDEFEEPVREELQHAGQEVADHLREEVRDAGQQVKQTAQEAVDTTSQDARESAGDVRDHAQESQIRRT